jgi:hypothetical protein
MLASIIKETREKQQLWWNKLVTDHNEHANKMRKVKSIIEDLGDDCIKLSMKFEDPTNDNINNSYKPRIVVVNIISAVDIVNAVFNEQGDIETIKVCGLGLFSLKGENHTIESFFKKIAPYLK